MICFTSRKIRTLNLLNIRLYALLLEPCIRCLTIAISVFIDYLGPIDGYFQFSFWQPFSNHHGGQQQQQQQQQHLHHFRFRVWAATTNNSSNKNWCSRFVTKNRLSWQMRFWSCSFPRKDPTRFIAIFSNANWKETYPYQPLSQDNFDMSAG